MTSFPRRSSDVVAFPGATADARFFAFANAGANIANAQIDPALVFVDATASASPTPSQQAYYTDSFASMPPSASNYAESGSNNHHSLTPLNMYPADPNYPNTQMRYPPPPGAHLGARYLPPPSNSSSSPSSAQAIQQQHQQAHYSSQSSLKRSSTEPMGSSGSTSGRKRQKKEDEEMSNVDQDDDDDDDDASPDPGPSSGNASQKPKATRGSRACTVCRRLKMKCVGAENGPPCKRCIAGKHQCVFEESNRGKRTSKKHEVLTKSLKKMEAQLETVMRSLKNPTIAGLVAANGGIPGIIPGTGEANPDDELAGAGAASEDGSTLDEHQPSLYHRAQSNSFRLPSSADSPPQSWGSGDDGSQQYRGVLTRNTENLTSHSPVVQAPASPRGDGGMHPPTHIPNHSHSRYSNSPHLPPPSGPGPGGINLQMMSVNPSRAGPSSFAHSIASGISSTPSRFHPHRPTSLSISNGIVADPSPSVVQATAATTLSLSPRLSTLPDNSLNPLGLLAEASLANRRASSRTRTGSGAMNREMEREMEANEMAAQLVDQAVNGEVNEDGEPQNANRNSGDASGGAIGGGEESVKSSSGSGGGGSNESSSMKGAERKVGVANETYFRPGPINILPLRRLFIERQVQPEMLSFVSTEEVMDLFRIYFTHMNRHCALLVPDFHTPSLVCSRSPFLLTVICAIASKFHTERPDLHPRLNRIVKKLAFNVPERGFKSLEIVQSYLLLALWGCGPVERFEQDKTWLLLGLAIRMGTDLNLHRKGVGLPADGPRAEWRARERELRNRERTWILCYVLDRSCSAQMGKPHSIIEDYIVRNTSTWYRLPECRPSDPGLAAYAELQRILSRSLDFLYSNTTSASGLHTDTDYLLVIKTIESQLYGWQENWNLTNLMRAGFVDLELSPPRDLQYVPLVTRFYFHYSMLVVNSFGLQNALERSRLDIGHFFGRCYSSAMACSLIIRDELGPQGFLRYSPDSHFVLSSYAVLTLLKLIRPEFQGFMESEQRTLSLVNDVANTLESVAINTSHTPALYSTFLRAVIAARTAGPSAPPSPRIDANGNNQGAPSAGLQGNSSGHGNVSNSTLDIALASNPAAGVFGEEQQFGDGALGLKMFPPAAGGMSLSGDGVVGGTGTPAGATPGGNISWTPAMSGNGAGNELDLQAMSFQLPTTTGTDDFSSMSMDNILSGGFWDNVLIPGYSSGGLEGLSGGFVYGSSGSGFITPRRSSPEPDAGASTFLTNGGLYANGKASTTLLMDAPKTQP